jgi:hypothetical protein
MAKHTPVFRLAAGVTVLKQAFRGPPVSFLCSLSLTTTNGGGTTHENNKLDSRPKRRMGSRVGDCVSCRTTVCIAGRRESDDGTRDSSAQKAAALQAFNDEKNKEFRDRDLYVYCFSLPEGNFTAYQSPVMIGTNVKELKTEQSHRPARL